MWSGLSAKKPAASSAKRRADGSPSRANQRTATAYSSATDTTPLSAVTVRAMP